MYTPNRHSQQRRDMNPIWGVRFVGSPWMANDKDGEQQQHMKRFAISM